MRIISGKYGGLRYSGKVPSGVRPSSDYLRESIFNILHNHIDMEGLDVCDLFAGSGGLGIEALSRGARHCLFVEKNRKTASFLKNLLEHFKIPSDDYDIIIHDVMKFLKSPDTKDEYSFDIIFCDPPYALMINDEVISAIEQNNILKKDGMLVIEHSTIEKVKPPGNWQLLTTRHSGHTTVDYFLRK